MNFTNRALTQEESWVASYESFVADLVQGYDMSIYEYTNDLSCRQILEEKRDDPLVADQWNRIQASDNLLKSILLPTNQCIHGSYPKDCFWFWGYPPNSPELETDLREIGAI